MNKLNFFFRMQKKGTFLCCKIRHGGEVDWKDFVSD